MPKKKETGAIPDRLLSTGDIARYCHTGITQVNRWIKKGDLEAFRNPGGHYRVTRDMFRKFLICNNMPVLEDFFQPSGSKILIVDDDPSVIKAYSILLKGWRGQTEIETASDGYEALLKAGSFKPDLMILDIRMPKIDGLEVCRRLRMESTHKGIRIIAVTAHAEAYDRETVLAAGADEYLIKPIEMETLLIHVGKLL
jgi:excisionase family DNA binding protein